MPVASYKLKFYLCVVRYEGLFPSFTLVSRSTVWEITSRSELTIQCIKMAGWLSCGRDTLTFIPSNHI